MLRDLADEAPSGMNITMTNVDSDLEVRSGLGQSYIKPYHPPRIHESPRNRMETRQVQSAAKMPSKSYREDEQDTPESTPRSALKRVMKGYTGESFDSSVMVPRDSEAARRLEREDVLKMQAALNKEYESKLKEVNDTAQKRLEDVQREHQKIIDKTYELYR